MMHSDAATRSPSSFSFTRSTPCVEGCCGPMLRIISSAPSTVVSISAVELWRVWSICLLLPTFDSQVLFHPGLILRQDVVILAQRISYPLFGQQNAPQIRVAVKSNAKHVENFALKPVRYRPDGNDCVHCFVFAEVGFQTQPLVLREGIEIGDEIESLLAFGPVDGGEIR